MSGLAVAVAVGFGFLGLMSSVGLVVTAGYLDGLWDDAYGDAFGDADGNDHSETGGTLVPVFVLLVLLAIPVGAAGLGYGLVAERQRRDQDGKVDA